MKLYHYETCPYCRKVRRYMEDKGIEIELLNARLPEISDELLAKGGKRQVPALLAGDEVIYESDVIIAYLAKNA